MPKRIGRETVYERAQRLRLKKLRRALQQMKRVSERDYADFLNPAADALEQYMSALNTLHTSHEAMLTLMRTALKQAEESGRPKKLKRAAHSALKRAEQSFAGSEPVLHQVMNLQWDALRALLALYHDAR
ncbi:MAG: hypothetical protein RLZZ342_115 [Candidatus Parcubacteria bacterium]|jgi:ribosomal protein L22